MALTKGDITDIRQVETTMTDAQGALIPAIRIFYRLRGNGPFSIDFAKRDFSGQAAVAMVTRDADERLKVIEAFS